MKNISFIVYLATSPAGKRYIGATSTSLAERMAGHRRAALINEIDNKFYRAIRKYGFESFSWRVVYVARTVAGMFRKEKELIKNLNTVAEGYNTTTGGEGCPGRKNTPEQSKRHGTAQRLRFSRKEEREHASATVSAFALNNPDKHQQNVSKRLATVRLPENRLLAASKQIAFAANNPETMAMRGAAHRARMESNPDIKRRISASLGGRPVEVIKDDKVILEFATQAECCDALGLGKGNVHSVLSGKRPHTRGYCIRYKNAEEGGTIPAHTNK